MTTETSAAQEPKPYNPLYTNGERQTGTIEYFSQFSHILSAPTDGYSAVTLDLTDSGTFDLSQFVLPSHGDYIGASSAGNTIIGSDGIDRIWGNGDGAGIFRGGIGEDRLYGGGGNDTLDGGADNDVIDGGFGNDMLMGAAGRDTFVFSTSLNAKTNADTIVDFTQGEDTIWLSKDVFSALGSGPVTAAEFTLGTKATTADQHLVYDQGTGKLYYDADGSGAAAQTLIATLGNQSSLDFGDVLVA